MKILLFRKLRTFLIGALLLGSAYAASESLDEFNSFRWNRKNALRGNGKIDEKPWFEWWYYKVVVPETNEAFFFHYGAVNPWDFEKTMGGTHAHIGAGDFTQKFIIDKSFPVKNFHASYDEVFVNVAGHEASDKKLVGDIKDDKNKLSWDIDIDHEWTFDAEGWGTGTGITNIEWYPAQASAKCNGHVVSNGKRIELKDAPCYQDRNWGKSFPEWWTWIVSNEFVDHPETVLAVGGGKPKFLNRFAPIEGVAIGLKHKGEEYHFRPNDLDDIDVDISFGRWEVTATNGSAKIVISAYAPEEAFMDLKFTTPEGVVFHDYEALIGEATVKIYKKRGFLIPRYDLIDTLYSAHTGIEYGSTDSEALMNIFSKEQTLFSTDKNKLKFK